MKHQQNDLMHVLRRPVETAAESGSSQLNPQPIADSGESILTGSYRNPKHIRDEDNKY
jgi:hypothetical protein